MDDNNDLDDYMTNPKMQNVPDQDSDDDDILENDFDSPFSPPGGVQDRIDDTHPSTDTNIDPMERYNDGIEGAADIDLPGEAADEDDEPPETEE